MIFEDLPGRTTLDKELRDKALNIARNLKYNGYQKDLDPMIYKVLRRRHQVVLLHVHG